jgi:hypothetical protein
MWYLLTIMLIGWSEVDSCQLSIWIAGSMEFEAVVPALPVHAKASQAFGYFVSVSSDELADMKHSAIHETYWSILHKQLVKYDQHVRKCLVAFPNKRLVTGQVEAAVVVCLSPGVYAPHSSLWSHKA